VTVTITSSDATSGVSATYYQLDGGALQTYSGAFMVRPPATTPLPTTAATWRATTVRLSR